MSNVNGFCNATSVSSFDNTNGKLILHYDYNEYINKTKLKFYTLNLFLNIKNEFISDIELLTYP